MNRWQEFTDDELRLIGESIAAAMGYRQVVAGVETRADDPLAGRILHEVSDELARRLTHPKQ